MWKRNQLQRNMEKIVIVNVIFSAKNILYLYKKIVPDIAEECEKKNGKKLYNGVIWSKEREKWNGKK